MWKCLNVYCSSGLHIDYLCDASGEVHILGIIELTIEYPYGVVHVANNTEAELSIKWIAIGSFCSNQNLIQIDLIAPHSLGLDDDRRIT